MYKRMTFLLLVVALVSNTLALGESITFTFANRAITGTTPKYLEFDVRAQAGSTGTTRLGDTQVYINYSTAGFGSSIVTNSKVTVTKGSLISGELVPGLPLYNITNVSDNTASRAAITVGYNYPVSPGSANLLLTSPTQLIHVKIEIADQGQNAGLSFEQSLLDGQQYESNNSTKYSPVTASDADNGVLPVEISSFTASVKSNTVNLTWQTATEVNNYGFDVERNAVSLNKNWETIGFVEGCGTANSPRDYSFVDNSTSVAGTYSYRLKQIDRDGSFKYSQVIEATLQQPTKFDLQQNYPNPFNPTTKLRYALAMQSRVRLEIYNVLGQRIETLVDKEQDADYYEVDWKAGIASGVYFARFEAVDVKNANNRFVDVRKMLLLH
jgi:hypothetical protein